VEVTPEEFDSLLRLLGPERERAAERYEDIRRKLIRLFEWKGCECPEDLTDETFNRVARNAAKQDFKLERPDPYSYFCGVAYRVYQEYLRDRSKERVAIDTAMLYPPVADGLEDPRLECFLRCLDRLPPNQRQLFLDYNPETDRIRARQKLADRFGIGLNALRIKVHRVRRQLSDCLAGCLGRQGR
jgi:DNA-directed RNA polymerase specialized sigma24 family protein